MKLRVPSFYKDFKCIAGACPDSCCQGWEVDIDADSLNYYKTVCGSVRQKIEAVLDKDEYENTVFRLTDRKRCPFLNDENLCNLHIATGGEHTPYTCRTFPRFIHDYGSLREIGISFSCPVAGKMMWNLKEKFSFTEEYNDLPPALNEIDAQTYFFLSGARKQAFQIVQNDSKPVCERLTELLDFGILLQKELDGYQEVKEGNSFFDVFQNPEVINPQWTEKVNHPEMRRVADKKCNENIASYFIYRYFLEAVYDRDVLSKIKMAVMGVLTVTYFGEDDWTLHLWSKETEHSDVNMARYQKALRYSGSFSAAALKKRLL